MQGREVGQRGYLDVEALAGELLAPGSVFAFLAKRRGRLFPDSMTEDLCRDVPGGQELLGIHATGYDYTRTGKPDIEWDDQAARDGLVSALVTDALALLAAVDPGPLDGKAADAYALLALVAGQAVEPAEGSDGTDGRWRIARRVAADRMISTVDPDTRHAHKTQSRQSLGLLAVMTHLVLLQSTPVLGP